VDWGADPVRKLLTAEMQEKMESAIGKLPAKYHVVFVLRDLEGLSIEETSKVLGLSPANVKIRLMRARLFLRGALAEYFHETNDNARGITGKARGVVGNTGTEARS
jgi:RNA polymerase sigma-70 factor (ECF subfamily)